jgi:hypothetical protein
VQSYLFEKGVTSIQGVFKAFVPRALDPAEPINWGEVIKENTRLTTEIISGKYGECTTFAGDGAHKLYQLYLAEATAGANLRGEDFDPRKYGNAAAKFFQYIQMVLNSNVPFVVFTCWDGHEKDDPDERGANPSRHIFPELPGQSAKRIMGEFAVVLYATRQGTGGATRYIWQTAPAGKVWGAGVKMPIEIAKKLPYEIEQDFSKLEKHLSLEI